MRIRKKGKIRLAALFAAALILLTGCSGCAGFQNLGKEAGGSSAKITEDGIQDGDTVIPRGRYLETVIDLSEQISGYKEALYRMEDGSLLIIDQNTDSFLRSRDNGTTWETDKRAWWTQLLDEKRYILDIAIGRDDTVAVIYDTSEDAEELQSVLEIIRPDGTKIPAELSLSEEDNCPWRVWIDGNGRVFAGTLSPAVYEIKEDGSGEKFLFMEEGIPEQIIFNGKYMLIDGYGYNGPQIYDLEAETFITDEVLAEFVQKNYPNRDTNGGSWYNLLYFPGEEEEIIYLAGEKGLYRHVIGGSAIEQIIDGSLCTFGNPAYSLQGMVLLDNQEFLTLFGNKRLVHFTYDPDVPTVPTASIKAYSLKENDFLRMAISGYQSKNPEVYVEYEVGMEQGSSMTREDALKKLNMEILAGTGPDLLILDGMPADSYQEKGLLLDLSTFVEELTGEEALFSNIIDAFRDEEGLYMLPCLVELPALLVEDEYAKGADSLSGLADIMEAQRIKHPEGLLVRPCSPKGIMKLFTKYSEPGWLTEKRELNRENLADYLEQTRRIYEAQMKGATEEDIRSYEAMNQRYLEYAGCLYEESDYFGTGVDALNYLMYDNAFSIGTVYYPYEYAELISVPRVENHENVRLFPLKGQDGILFEGKTLAGINAASKNREETFDLLKELLSKENGILSEKLPINRAALEENLQPNPDYYTSDEEPYAYLSFGDSEGFSYTFEIYWPTEREKQELITWMESASVPCVNNQRLEEAVYEEGSLYLRNKRSLEDTLDAIAGKVALYMAE